MILPSLLLLWILSSALAFKHKDINFHDRRSGICRISSSSRELRPATSSTLAPTTTSPWSTAEWRINLQIGRPPGSGGDESDANDSKKEATWGASGVQLVLPIKVRVGSERYTKDQTEKEFMGGSGACDVLTVLEDAVYIPDMETGQQTVRFASSGAWKLSTRQVASSDFTLSHMGQGGVVRFWIDVLDAVAKRDVSIPAQTRLYCTTKCWRQSDFIIGTQRMQPLHRDWQALSDEIDARLEHDTGDRRLDGTNAWDTALASLDMARLIQDRDETWRQIQRASEQGLYPVPPGGKVDYSLPGPWPGTTEDLIMARGAIVIAQPKGVFGLWRDYRTIGTWTATPVPPSQD